MRQNPDADREALLAWGEACQTLSAITLSKDADICSRCPFADMFNYVDGREWKLVLGEWVALQESVAR